MAIKKISEFVAISSPQYSDKLLIERNGSGKSVTVENLFNGLRVNYLRSSLATTTMNGVTCTNNGDGTYTLNGTATKECRFILDNNVVNKYSGYKLKGCPSGGSSESYMITINYFGSSGELLEWSWDVGNGLVIKDSPFIQVYICILSGITVNNLVFKPMITDNLSATYDDFISFDDSFVKGVSNGLNLDLLWTNASPSSAFSPQTIKLNLSGYKMVLIDMFTAIGGYNTANYARECILLTIGFDANFYRGLYGEFAVYRKISVGTESIRFGEATDVSLSGASADNRSLVPDRIYGVK